MILRPDWPIASTIRSGSSHSKLALFLPSILRHSKRCLTQWKPASLASFRSRAVVAALPHRKTWTAGSVLGILPPTSGAGDATAGGDDAGLAATVVAGAPALGVGGTDGLEHALTASIRAPPSKTRRKRDIQQKGGLTTSLRAKYRWTLDRTVDARGANRVQRRARRAIGFIDRPPVP